MANQVSFFEIISKNSVQLGEFYGKTFGWNIIPPQGSMEYRLMDTKGGNGVMGAVGEPIIKEETWLTIYISVDNIDQTLEDVVNNGGKIKAPKFSTDTGFTLAYIEDLSGNIIGITENRKE
ncbi:Glyoxalase-like domain protein [compost metagenome]